MGDKGDIELLGIGAGSGIGAKRNSATKIIGLAFGVLCFGFAAYYAYDRFVVNDPSSANTVAESKTEPPVKEAVTTTEEEVAAEEEVEELATVAAIEPCLLYTSPSPRDRG